jgi:DnaK suppressor protein
MNLMDLETQTHLPVLRGLLEYRLSQLRAEVHADVIAQRAVAPVSDEVLDQKDEAARWQEAEVADAQTARDLGELLRAEHALQRMEDGVYGDCLGCGEPIGLQRLEVQPEAEYCAACQREREHAARAAKA